MINVRSVMWTIIFALVFTWSAINPRDYFTWMLEVAPAVIAFMLLIVTWHRFPLTSLSYVLILVHAIILMIGGHYTYAEVPFFDGLLGMERNNYDKLGHLAQGFIPAIVAREILLRHHVVNGSGWLFLFIVSFCLAFSAFYELIEWWVAVFTATGAEAFLGTQGYEWDTQSDMALALTGAVISLLMLSRLHDRQLSLLALPPERT